MVSLTGAIEGNADISLGNVVGSNIFNTLFILGLTALILPVSMTDKNRRRDIPICLAVMLVLLGLGMADSLLGTGRPDMLSRWEGVLLLLLFAGYLFYCFKTDGGNADHPAECHCRIDRIGGDQGYGQSWYHHRRGRICPEVLLAYQDIPVCLIKMHMTPCEFP